MNIQMLIAGQEVDAQSGARFVRCNPLSGEAVTLAPAASAADARRAADAAAAALPAWAALGSRPGRNADSPARQSPIPTLRPSLPGRRRAASRRR